MIRSTFAVPLAIALLTCAGLFVALTGDGWRDGASWIALAAPIATAGWALRNRQTSLPPEFRTRDRQS